MMQMMRVRILVCMCALMSCDGHTHPASVKDSDEQTALQEALLLVELLKSEYARVLRERSITKEKEIDGRDLPTCAPTTSATDAVTQTQTHTDNTIRHSAREGSESSTTETLKPHTAHSYRRAYHPSYGALSGPRPPWRPPQADNLNYYDFPRRRFNNYPDYYGIYRRANPWRRMDYENMYRGLPGKTTSTVSESISVSVTNSPTDTTLSSISTTASTAVSELPTSSILSQTSNSSTIHSSTTVSSTTPKSARLSATLKLAELSIPTALISTSLPTLSVFNIKQPSLISKRFLSLRSDVNTVKNKTQTKKRSVSEKIKHKKLSLSVKKTTVTSTSTSTSTYEPEQAQLAAELENELGAAIDSSTSLPSSSSHPRSVTWRPSTRVHMAKSTPYHLPLPENHAFCYTNPKNSLCRTFIK